jgi:hypothetical protein
MNSRTFFSAAVVIGLACVVLGFAFLQKGGQQKIAQRQKDLEDQVVKVTEPMTSSIRHEPRIVDGQRLTIRRAES